MARFDLHALPGEEGLVVDVQSDLLDPFSTRVVVPLVPLGDAPSTSRRLNPVFEIDGQPMIFAAHLVAAVPTAGLGLAQGSLAERRDAIRDALDMVFIGF